MIWHPRALAALTEDLGSILRTHTSPGTWYPLLASVVHRHTGRQNSHKHKIIIILKISDTVQGYRQVNLCEFQTSKD